MIRPWEYLNNLLMYYCWLRMFVSGTSWWYFCITNGIAYSTELFTSLIYTRSILSKLREARKPSINESGLLGLSIVLNQVNNWGRFPPLRQWVSLSLFILVNFFFGRSRRMKPPASYCNLVPANPSQGWTLYLRLFTINLVRYLV